MAKSRKQSTYCISCGKNYITIPKPLTRWKNWFEDSRFKIREVTHTCPHCGQVHNDSQIRQPKNDVIDITPPKSK